MLIRHAKAAAGDRDIDRTLSDRGVADAAAIGRWLAGHDISPDLVVVSPARRAAQTWQLAATAMAHQQNPAVDGRIYDNTESDLLAVIRETPDDVHTLVLVGHNPSIGDLANGLDDGTGPEADCEALARSYPTSGVSVFAVDSGWSEVDFGGAGLVSFAVPRG